MRPLPYLPRLYLRGVFATTRMDPLWYRHFAYAEEKARGYDATEDLWSPLEWEWTLRPDAQAFVLFSIDEVAADPDRFLEEERRRRQAFARTQDPVFDELASRAEAFLVDADHRSATILAGYPWLADWGRQAMIAAPGLAQASGRLGAVARVLNGFAEARRDGLVPSHFSGEEGDADYDSVDASLWFILAVDWFGRARRNPQRPFPAARRRARDHRGVSPRHAVRHPRRTGRTARRERRGPRADVDGRGRRRRAGDAALGPAGRGQRALARGAQVARRGWSAWRAKPAARASSSPRPGTWPGDSTKRSGMERGAASTTTSGMAGRTRACAPTRSWPCP